MSEPQTSLPPHVRIIQMGTACWVSRLVCTAASLRLADHLAGGPKSADELAGPTGTNPRALHRFMRTLASFGILTQDHDSRFALTPLGDALRSDAPGAARSTVLTMAGPWMWADMVMLAIPGGEERTAGEYRTLLAAAGLQMTRVVPTASDVSIVEAELT